MDYKSAKINNSLEIHWSLNNNALHLWPTRTQGCTSGAVNCSTHAVISLRTIIVILHAVDAGIALSGEDFLIYPVVFLYVK